jgi:hypothetical protein
MQTAYSYNWWTVQRIRSIFMIIFLDHSACMHITFILFFIKLWFVKAFFILSLFVVGRILPGMMVFNYSSPIIVKVKHLSGIDIPLMTLRLFSPIITVKIVIFLFFVLLRLFQMTLFLVLLRALLFYFFAMGLFNSTALNE